jgi:hypothetical protein
MTTLEDVLILQDGTRKWIAPELGECTDAVAGELANTANNVA